MGSGGRSGSGVPSRIARGTCSVIHGCMLGEARQLALERGEAVAEAGRALDRVVGVGGDDVHDARRAASWR